MTILLVTGTGTDVGKTVVTAALAACAGGSVAVVKPVQTGIKAGDPGDLAEVSRLSGCREVHEFARYPDPLAPHHAAALSRLPELDVSTVGARISALAQQHDLVLVEGAGGLLVPYNRAGWTLVDLAVELRAPLILVTSASLGTLNYTALTVRLIAAQSLELAGIVVGSWPPVPGLAERANISDLARLSGHGELAGVLPAALSTSPEFARQARAALTPGLGGTFDWSAFQAAAGIRELAYG